MLEKEFFTSPIWGCGAKWLGKPHMVWQLMFIYFHLKVSEELWSSRENKIRNVCKRNPLIMKKSRQQAEVRAEHSRAQSENIYNTKLMSNIVHIKNLNLNWCLVPKAASTSISSALLPYLPNMNLSEGRPHIQQEVWEREDIFNLVNISTRKEKNIILGNATPICQSSFCIQEQAGEQYKISRWRIFLSNIF